MTVWPWDAAAANTYHLPATAWPINTAAANPAGSTIIIQPGQTYTCHVLAAGCAPAFTGWWTTINVGPVWPGDDGTAGVREPVGR